LKEYMRGKEIER